MIQIDMIVSKYAWDIVAVVLAVDGRPQLLECSAGFCSGLLGTGSLCLQIQQLTIKSAMVNLPEGPLCRSGWPQDGPALI